MATLDHNARPAHYLDDLSVGQRFSTREHALDHQQIVEFARQFDPQPFHLDDEAARDTLFGGLAASGWHTAALTMKLLVETGLAVAGGIVGAGAEVSWPRPTRPDSVLRVDSEITEIKTSRSRPDRGIVTLRSQTVDQHGQVLQVLVSKLVVPRRNA